MRKIYLCAAAAAVVLSSCSKNEVTEKLTPADKINSIGMSVATGVTRGIETTTATIETNNQIRLDYYGTAAGDAAGVDEGDLTLNYNTAKDAWDQPDLTNAKLWSSLDLTNGASFYSMHEGDNPLPPTSRGKAEATYDIFTPKANIADQKDLVCYAGSISAMPAAGYIRGNFNHALSRVEIYSNQGDFQPVVKTVDVKNLKESGVATLKVDGTCTWEVAAAAATSYSYYAAPANTALVADDQDYVSAATNVAAKNMIIVPQALVNASTEIATLDGSADKVVATDAGYDDEAQEVMTTSAFTKIAGSYVKVLYRMMDASNADVAGYIEAAGSSSYQSMKTAGTPVLPTTINDASELYILAGFPFADGQTFESTKDYDAYLGFGANGGYLLYQYYFDANGNPTNIKVDGLETNDPVINPDAPIGIMVNVTNWVSGGDVTVE